MASYEWLPLHIQLWIWGTASIVGVAVAVLLWFRWGRPLRNGRVRLEEADGYRQLAVLEGKHRINQLIDNAEAAVWQEVSARLRDDRTTAEAAQIIEVRDVSQST